MIPGGFNMVWDSSDTLTSISGTGSSKVDSAVSYEAGDKTLLIDVTTDFADRDSITVSGLSFKSFTAISAADNLELDIDDDATADATDDKTIQITPAIDVNYRSVGTDTLVLYDAGLATIAAGSATITFFGGSVSLPTNVGAATSSPSPQAAMSTTS